MSSLCREMPPICAVTGTADVGIDAAHGTDNRSERTLDDLDDAVSHGGDIESHMSPCTGGSEPIARHAAQTQLFAFADRLERRSVRTARSSLDLADHDVGTLARHDVDLTACTVPVTSQNLVAVLDVPRGNHLFGAARQFRIARRARSSQICPGSRI